MAFIYDPKLGYARPVRNELEAFKVAGDISVARSRAESGSPIGSGTPKHARDAYDQELERQKRLERSTPLTSHSSSQRAEHTAKGGNFHRGIPVPELTEEEKRQNAIREADKLKRKEAEAAQRSIESAKHDADEILHLVKTNIEDGNLERYIQQNGDAELKELLKPFDYEFDPLLNHNLQYQPQNNKSSIDRLDTIYKNGALQYTLYNTSTETSKFRHQWREYLEKVSHDDYAPVIEKTKKSRLSSAVAFLAVATLKFGVTATVITIGGKMALDANGGSLISKTQCVTSDIGVNIRTEPTSWQREKTVITRLPFESTVQTRGAKINDDWYRATTNYRGQTITGYVHGDYIGKCTP